jgi:hypothetical protein
LVLGGPTRVSGRRECTNGRPTGHASSHTLGPMGSERVPDTAAQRPEPESAARARATSSTLAGFGVLPAGSQRLQRAAGNRAAVPLSVWTMVHESGHTIESSGRFRAAIQDEFTRLLRGAREPIANTPHARGTDAREKFCEGFARFKLDRAGLAERSTAIVAFFAGNRHLP